MLKGIGQMFLTTPLLYPPLYRLVSLPARIGATVVSCAFLLCLSFSHGAALERDSSREMELFSQAYESYLSYQPAKAVETFRVFIREFPGSSAEDAAYFWMGKALLQVNAPRDALLAFSHIREKYPASPYLQYVNREIDSIASLKKENGLIRDRADDAVLPDLAEKGKGGQQRAGEDSLAAAPPVQKRQDTSSADSAVQTEKIREAEKALAAAKSEIEKISEERDRMRVLYEEEKKKRTAELLAKIAEIERRDALQTTPPGPSRTDNEEEKARLRKERDDLRDKLREYEENTIVIRDKKYTANQILDYLIVSSSVLFRLGIRDIVWASGNMYDDFVTDHILYEEAQKVSLVNVTEKSRELARHYNLSRGEEDYLFRYLAIRELVQEKMFAMTGRDHADMLMISFTEENRGESVLLATEVQRMAREGKSFETLQKEFAGKVALKSVPVNKLPDWIAEKYRSLLYNEASDILWTDEGFIIIRNLGETRRDITLEDAPPEVRQRLKTSLREWVTQIR